MSIVLSEVLKVPNVKMFDATAVEDLLVTRASEDESELIHFAGVGSNWTLVTQNHDT